MELSVQVIFHGYSLSFYLCLLSVWRRRRTSISRKIALGAGIAVILILWYLPASFALAVQTRLSAKAFDPASITISFNPGVLYEVDQPQVRGENAYVRLAVGTIGLPPNIEAAADALEGTIEWPDGKTLPVKLADLHQSPIVLPRRSDLAGNDVKAVFDWVSLMAPAALRQKVQTGNVSRLALPDAIREYPVEDDTAIQIRPVNVANGIQCYTCSIDYLLCRSALRWPKRIVYADFGQGMLPVWKTTYSPFPAAIDVSTIEEHLSVAAGSVEGRFGRARHRDDPVQRTDCAFFEKTSNSRASLCASQCRLLFTSTPPLNPLNTGNEGCLPIVTEDYICIKENGLMKLLTVASVCALILHSLIVMALMTRASVATPNPAICGHPKPAISNNAGRGFLLRCLRMKQACFLSSHRMRSA